MKNRGFTRRSTGLQVWLVAGAAALLAPRAEADAAAAVRTETPVGTSATPSAERAASSSTPRLWAGHQVAFGTRKVPVLGTLSTRTDTLVLARLQRTDGGWRLVQQACDIAFAPVARVNISMDVRGLPTTVTELREGDEPEMTARAKVSWGDEDVDDDGNPGMTVEVDSSICAGSLYVASESTSRGTARFGTRFLSGWVDTTIRQRILGADGLCLGSLAEDSREEVAGPFAYVPVDDDATCASLLERQWPVDAMPNE